MAIISLHGKIGSGKDLGGEIIQYLTSDHGIKGTRTFEESRGKVDKFGYSNFWRYDSKFEIKKFADKLKDTICLWLSCTREQLEDREFKEKELGPEWWYYQNPSNELISYLNNTLTENQVGWCKLIKLTPRKLLQILGTEAGRNIIHPDIWVNLLFSDYKPTNLQEKFRELAPLYPSPSFTTSNISLIYPNWIITDNRFPNEIARVKQEKGITIKIVRPINLRFPEAWRHFDQSCDKLYPRTEENFMEWLKTRDHEDWKKLYTSLTHYSETALDNYNDFDYIIENDGTIEDLIQKFKNILIKEKII